jgi:hypothetical protein
MEEPVLRDERLRRKSPFRDQQSRRVVLTSRRKWLKRVRHYQLYDVSDDRARGLLRLSAADRRNQKQKTYE